MIAIQAVVFTVLAVFSSAEAGTFTTGNESGALISRMSEADIDKYLQDLGPVRSTDVVQRFIKSSSLFIGLPYGVSPLGEGNGGGPDVDPLWSFTVVDCQTFIEEAVAMAVSDSFAGFMENLLAIRYSDGVPSFESRNHLPDLQWIPNNVAKGYLRDITSRVGGSETRVLKRDISFDRVEIPVDGKKLAVYPVKRGSKVSLKYIPIETARKTLDSIPDGTILFIVRVENPRKAFMITHMGIVVVRGDGTRYLRHASNHFGSIVSDMLLGVYLTSLDSYQNWPALGISLFQPVLPPGRTDVNQAK